MGAHSITLCEYHTLARRFSDVEITQTDGLLMTRGFLPGRGYVMALQPCASARVTLIDATPACALRAEGFNWLARWMRACGQAG